MQKEWMVPIVIGALGTLSNNFSSWAAKIEVEAKINVGAKSFCARNGKDNQERSRDLRSRVLT